MDQLSIQSNSPHRAVILSWESVVQLFSYLPSAHSNTADLDTVCLLEAGGSQRIEYVVRRCCGRSRDPRIVI